MRSRAARTGIIGSSVPCCTSTGIDATASQSTSSASHPGANGLIASTPAGRNAVPPRSATASAMPAPWENPPKIASPRGRSSAAHCSSMNASTWSTASMNACSSTPSAEIGNHA